MAGYPVRIAFGYKNWVKPLDTLVGDDYPQVVLLRNIEYCGT